MPSSAVICHKSDQNLLYRQEQTLLSRFHPLLSAKKLIKIWCVIMGRLFFHAFIRRYLSKKVIFVIIIIPPCRYQLLNSLNLKWIKIYRVVRRGRLFFHAFICKKSDQNLLCHQGATLLFTLSSAVICQKKWSKLVVSSGGDSSFTLSSSVICHKIDQNLSCRQEQTLLFRVLAAVSCRKIREKETHLFISLQSYQLINIEYSLLKISNISIFSIIHICCVFCRKLGKHICHYYYAALQVLAT